MPVVQFKARHPEPVPAASQFVTLPFVASVEGYVRGRSADLSLGRADQRLRVALHRRMNRNGEGYLQQLSSYAGEDVFDSHKAGRILPVTQGIIGWSHSQRRVFRTKAFDTEPDLIAAMRDDRLKIGEGPPNDDTPRSYLAVPMLAADGVPVTILYADTLQFGLFANDDVVRAVIAMCDGFCRMMDNLSRSPLPGIRNYPMMAGEAVVEDPTVYESIQEEFEAPPPRYESLTSLNFEAGS